MSTFAEIPNEHFVETGSFVPSGRINVLAEAIFATAPEVEADRAEIITASYKESEGRPVVTRRAMAFEKIMQELPIVIRPGELIVGNLTRTPRGVQVFPEYSCAWIENELDTFASRLGDPFKISEETKGRLRKLFPYWKGKTNSDLANQNLARHPEVFPAMEANVFTVANYRFAAMGHVTVGYEEVLQYGFKGIIAKAMRAILELDPQETETEKRKAFLEAVIICAKSIIHYAHRCAKHAESLAEQETNFERKEELLRIGEICRTVPENPAKTFHEGLQAFWFTHMALYLESNGHSMSPGRFDQYMYSCYKNSVIDGGMGTSWARELLDSLWVKFNEVCKLRDAAFAKGFGGYPMFQNLNVGGQKAKGGDATNRLSFECLEASIRTRLPQPSLSIRVWENTPQSLLQKGAELARTGIGMPSWFNDDIVMKSILHRNIPVEDARNYAILGCVEPNIPGRTLGMHGSAFFNFVKVLEITLNNGRLNNVQVGPATGDPRNFKSMDELLYAFKRQMAHFVDMLVIADNDLDSAHGERNPLPYQSSLIEDCIAQGKSAQEGGARFNMTAAQGVGVANVADALMTIKMLVFESREIDMDLLLALLESNYGASFTEDTFDSFTADAAFTPTELSTRANAVTLDTGEYYRQMILNRVPKYGNDIEEVDELAKMTALVFCEELDKHVNVRGGRFMAGLYPVSSNVPMGKVCGATADGRRAGEPLADGISPSAGQDRHGPTAALNSVARLVQSLAGNGALLNQKFHPSALEGETGLKNLVFLVKTYFARGGSHVQFNVIGRDTLLAAKNDPEKYKNLVIRVAGYSAHFVTLNSAIQDDVISRTEQTF